MFHVIRSSLKYSLRRIGISLVKMKNVNTSRRTLTCINNFMFNCNHGDVEYNIKNLHVLQRTSKDIDRCIKKLYMDAEGFGRISINDVEEVLEEIKSARIASAKHSLMIIRFCGNLLIEEPPEKRTELVQKMWKTLEDVGVNLSIDHYNALLNVYLQNEFDFVPDDVLADVRKRGLEANSMTYRLFIARYCQTREIDNATRTLDFMREKGMPINVDVCNSLILGYSLINNMEKAEEVFKSLMIESRIEPNSETYAHFICGYIKYGNIKKVNYWLHAYKLRNIMFSDIDIFRIVHALSIHGYENEIEEFLFRLKRKRDNQKENNVVYRLVSAGHFELAYKMLENMPRTTRANGSYHPVANFFMSHMVRCDASPDTVLKYCKRLISNDLNPEALSIAMISSLQFGKENTALALFRDAKENGTPLRPHYFWPLLVSRAKTKDITGIFDILSLMSKEFNITPDARTLCDYVIPFILRPDLDVNSLILDLKPYDCSVAAVVSSLVINLLNRKHIKKAAEIALQHNTYYPSYFFRRPLIESYLESKDVQSFVFLLKKMSDGIRWRMSNSNYEEDKNENEIFENRELIGEIIVEVANTLNKESNCTSELRSILAEMLKIGVHLDNNSAKEIRNILQDQLTLDITVLLKKLLSNELCSLPIVPKGPTVSPMKELEAENVTLTKHVYLIDTYVKHNKPAEALEVYENVSSVLDSFKNPAILLRFVFLLVQNDKIEKALNILKDTRNAFDSTEKSVRYECVNFSRKVLDKFAEKGDVEKVNEFFDLFISLKLIEVNNYILGPLIKANIKRKDYDAAVDAFERCCLKYCCTPWKSELFRIFITNEDIEILKKLIDLSTRIHGKENTFFDLMISYLECGRIKKAKKILEFLKSHRQTDRLKTACLKYEREGAVEYIKNLLHLTKDFNTIDRSQIFYCLLSLYDKADDVQAALRLWKQMQDENVNCTKSFSIRLSKILTRHKIDVPFTVPLGNNSNDIKNEYGQKMRYNSFSKNLSRYLNTGQVDGALKLKQKFKGKQVSWNDYTLLIESCLRKNKYKEAVKLFDELLSEYGQLPKAKVFKYLLKTAMSVGDVEFINGCDGFCSKNMKSYLAYDNTRCRAYVNSNRIEEYLFEYEKKLDSIQNKEELTTFMDSFSRGGFVTLFKLKPEYIPRAKKLFEKILEKDGNILVPYNTLWLYYMLEKKFDEAQKIWDYHLCPVTYKVTFKEIMTEIQQNYDTELGMVLLDMLVKKPDVPAGAFGIVCGVTIKALVQKNQIEEALELLKKALTKTSIDKIFRSTLEALKAACQAKNIQFPYTLPIPVSHNGRERAAASKNNYDN